MTCSFTSDVLQFLRQTIAATGGNEVFFVGRTNADLRVVEIEVLARGNVREVPAILQGRRHGEVVIHNHPSGTLQPSTADIHIASQLADLGVGFYIVDNPVENVYRVVEPFPPQKKHPIEPQGIGHILGPDGLVARSLDGYEDRPEQLRMAFAAGEAFNDNRLAVIEAGTGTGKSLAYLVPAIIWALANEERVVVSTNTINLQEQLIRKDIPFLQHAAGLEFRAVLVKGRNNYLCLRRAETARLEPGLFEDDLTGELNAILDWAASSPEGSKEELPFIPQEQVWEEVRCEIDQCARVRCQHYARCFFHKARRQAAAADLLVVNHALLLSDLALRLETDNYTASAVLPPFDRIILDEAHHLEDVATNFFSAQVTRFTFARPLNRLRHPRKPEKGLLPRLLNALSRELPDSEDQLYRALHERMENLLMARQGLAERSVGMLEQIGQDLATALQKEIRDREEIKYRVIPSFSSSETWDSIRNRVRELAAEADLLGKGVRELLRDCDRVPETVYDKLHGQLTDLRGIAGRLEGIAGDLRFFMAEDPAHCTWLEVGKRRIGRGSGILTRLCTAPLEVAEPLKKGVYDRFKTVIMTSATLAVGQSFDYFKHRVGLDRTEPGRVTELLLPSPFAFHRQALVAIPSDITEPGRSGFPEMVRDLTERAILAADGRSFVLFTAYSLLRRVHGEIAPVLTARGYHCLRQGEDNRHRLLKKFTADPTSVLFGTDSFWEGVDVPGRALEQVIITRLPFKVPTEPVLEARAEAIEQAGGDPFMQYTVPQAVIKFKQGFGRLIRHREDRGVVLILDARVVNKGYGRIFLRSLPDAAVVTAPTNEVMAAMERFFRQRENPP
ncbi:MAG: helicase C-terminal domain-containing protein [Desulfuromonadaceae bacterium]